MIFVKLLCLIIRSFGGGGQIQEASDTLIVVPNQNLLGTMSKSTTFVDAFRMVDNVLFESVRSITDLLTMPGQVNVDFADVQTVRTRQKFSKYFSFFIFIISAFFPICLGYEENGTWDGWNCASRR